ncbi:MAG: HugZ family protein [Spirulinaceae cyanobacterium SM2_1_0]|nr:HugZ family protein [Spirulinaceae cyanobacterium SM2_1_0]
MPPTEATADLITKLSQQCRSAILATATIDGQPTASYAPFWQDESGCFYIFVSGLSAHTGNLHANPQVSLMLIADEAASGQIFARPRLTWQCTAQLVPRDTVQWSAIATQFQDKFGEIITTLRQLPDFRIFALRPSTGQLVSGFGAAQSLPAPAPHSPPSPPSDRATE